jgi:hypothetical protein
MLETGFTWPMIIMHRAGSRRLALDWVSRGQGCMEIDSQSDG